MTTVLLVARARPIHPFGKKPDACGLGASTFGAYRDDTLRALGLPQPRVVDDDARVEGPALVLADDVWVTRRALRGFLRHAKGPSRLALPPSRLLDLTLPLQDVPVDGGRAAFEVAYIPQGHATTAREALALDAAHWVDPGYRERALDVPVPRYILGTQAPTTTFPLTSSIALRVRHWIHVLRAAHFMPQVALLEHATSHPLTTLVRAATSIRPTRASMLRALRAAFVVKGRGAFIHPRAVVEASVVGDGAWIGPNAVVLNSIIGEGSVVEERAHVKNSTLGPRSFVSINSVVSACAVFGDTDACINGMQGCVVDERCALTSFAHPLDLGGAGRVDDDGALRETGELPCGVAFGAGVFIGAGVYVAPGRAIPAGVKLVGDPATTLRKVARDVEPGTYFVRDGALTRA